MRNKIYLFLTVTVAAMSGLLFGYDTGIIADALPFLKMNFHLTTYQEEIVVALVPFGAFMGSIGTGKLTDKFGRVRCLQVASLFFLFGTVCLSNPKTIYDLYLGRFLLGLGIGVASYSAPLYISEVAPSNWRGLLVIMNTIAITGGIVVAYCVGYECAKFESWKTMFALGFIPAAILFFGSFALPKSPRWLKIQKQKLNPVEKVQGKKFLILMGCLLACVQQFSGINAVLYYAPEILKMLHANQYCDQFMMTLFLGLSNFIGTLFSAFFVDKIGRRPILLMGLFIMTSCLFILSSTSHWQLSSSSSYSVLICLLAYILFYAMSVGCLFWLLIAEIFPLELRGVGMSLAAASNWLANLVVSLSTLTIAEWFSIQSIFFGFGVISLMSLVYCVFFVPETKKVSLEKIQFQYHLKI